MFPDSAVRPMVDNEILQIVVFSILFGIACAAMGERAKLLLDGIEGLSHVILRVTGYVMLLAPIAVFCAIAATISTNGLGILVNYAKFMGEFYLGLLCLWLVLIIVGFLLLGSQSQAADPTDARAIPACFFDGKFGSRIPKDAGAWRSSLSPATSPFVLPLGYSFNLDGTMMYCTFASVFIAQAYESR